MHFSMNGSPYWFFESYACGIPPSSRDNAFHGSGAYRNFDP